MELAEVARLNQTLYAHAALSVLGGHALAEPSLGRQLSFASSEGTNLALSLLEKTPAPSKPRGATQLQRAQREALPRRGRV